MCKGTWGAENGVTVEGVTCHAEKHEHEEQTWMHLKQKMFMFRLSF